MARTLEEVNVEYTQTLAQAGEKTYLIHVKSEEIETHTQDREKLLNKAKTLSREAWAIQQRLATPAPAAPTEPTATEPTQAQDAVEAQ